MAQIRETRNHYRCTNIDNHRCTIRPMNADTPNPLRAARRATARAARAHAAANAAADARNRLIIAAHDAGHSLAEIAAACGRSKGMIQRWVATARATGDPTDHADG